MSNPAYRNVENVYAAARKIADDLAKYGQEDAAREITTTINNFWTTSSEALGETRLTLLNLRPTVEKYAGAAVPRLLDEAAKDADDLWHGSPPTHNSKTYRTRYKNRKEHNVNHSETSSKTS